LHLQNSLIIENVGASLGRDDVDQVFYFGDLAVSENLYVGVPVFVSKYYWEVVKGIGTYNNQWCFLIVHHIGFVADEIVVYLDHHFLVALDGLNSVGIH
jgi:hypothetical protein